MSTEGFYADGTSGHAGGSTSRERAEREDATGVTGKRSKEVYALLQHAPQGMTVKDVERALGVGHGAASGALTRLHRAGHIKRSTLRLRGQEIYFHPDHFPANVEEAPYRPTTHSGQKARDELQALVDEIHAVHEIIGEAATGLNASLLRNIQWQLRQAVKDTTGQEIG